MIYDSIDNWMITIKGDSIHIFSLATDVLRISRYHQYQWYLYDTTIDKTYGKLTHFKQIPTKFNQVY